MSITKMIAPLVNVVALAGAVVISGCTSERFGSPYGTTPTPPPIRAVPSDPVSQTPLAPPEGVGEYPSAPLGGDDAQMAGLDPQAQGSWDAITSGIELTPALVAGVWRAEVDGLPCQIATPMTKFGQGYRAGPMRCPVALTGVNSWNVEGTRLMFYNREGAMVAQLSSSNGTGFSGRMISGSTLTLSR